MLNCLQLCKYSLLLFGAHNVSMESIQAASYLWPFSLLHLYLKENEMLEEMYAVSVQNMPRNINLVKIRNMCTIE